MADDFFKKAGFAEIARSVTDLSAKDAESGTFKICGMSWTA